MATPAPEACVAPGTAGAEAESQEQSQQSQRRSAFYRRKLRALALIAVGVSVLAVALSTPGLIPRSSEPGDLGGGGGGDRAGVSQDFGASSNGGWGLQQSLGRTDFAGRTAVCGDVMVVALEGDAGTADAGAHLFLRNDNESTWDFDRVLAFNASSAASPSADAATVSVGAAVACLSSSVVLVSDPGFLPGGAGFPTQGAVLVFSQDVDGDGSWALNQTLLDPANVDALEDSSFGSWLAASNSTDGRTWAFVGSPGDSLAVPGETGAVVAFELLGSASASAAEPLQLQAQARFNNLSTIGFGCQVDADEDALVVLSDCSGGANASTLALLLYDEATGEWAAHDEVAVTGELTQAQVDFQSGFVAVGAKGSGSEGVALYRVGNSSELGLVDVLERPEVAGFGSAIALGRNLLAVGSSAGSVHVFVTEFVSLPVLEDQDRRRALQLDAEWQLFQDVDLSGAGVGVGVGGAAEVLQLTFGGEQKNGEEGETLLVSAVSASDPGAVLSLVLEFDETAQPTAAPTVSPTESPSASPTVSPTLSPSASPSESPTAAPTAEEETEVPTIVIAIGSALGGMGLLQCAVLLCRRRRRRREGAGQGGVSGGRGAGGLGMSRPALGRRRGPRGHISSYVKGRNSELSASSWSSFSTYSSRGSGSALEMVESSNPVFDVDDDDDVDNEEVAPQRDAADAAARSRPYFP